MRSLAILFLLTNIAFSQTGELLWQPEGVPVRQGYSIKWNRATCAGFPGEVIAAWTDTRFGIAQTFVQKIDMVGDPLWDEDIALGTIASNAMAPAITSDGEGGAFVIWRDFRSDDSGDIYAQHLNSEGGLLLLEGGLEVCGEENLQQSISSCTDDAGGVFISWVDERFGIGHPYIAQILADGSLAPCFEINGSAVCSEAIVSEIESSLSMVADDINGVWLTWRDDRLAEGSNILAQHIDSSGELLNPDLGVMICDAEGIQYHPKLASDGNGGVFICWEDRRVDNQGDIYLQHLAVSGTPSFSVNGLPLTAVENSIETNNRIIKTVPGHAIVSWEDNRNDPGNTVSDIYAQKVNTVDAALWGEGGVAICTAVNDQIHTRINIDQAGGAFICWIDYRLDDVIDFEDVYVQHITSGGTCLWGEAENTNGKAMTTFAGSQTSPYLHSDQNGGVFALWRDNRYGSVGIFSNCLNMEGETRYQVEDGRELIWGIDGDATNLASTATTDNGVIFVWEDKRTGESLIVTQKLTDQSVADGVCEVNWEPNGLVLHPAFNDNAQMAPQIAPAGEGAFIGFHCVVDDNMAVFLTLIEGNGAIPWGEPVSLTESFNGSPLDYQQELKICPDGYGGVLAAWSELRLEEHGWSTEVYTQRLNAAGNRLWSSDGVRISEDDQESILVDLLADETGGVYLLWCGGLWSNYDVWLQHLDSNGDVVTGWPQGGLAICTAGYDQEEGVLAPFYDGELVAGVYAVWNDLRNNESGDDIYAQKVTSGGSILWDTDGIPLATEISTQLICQLEPDGNNGFNLLWQDFSNEYDYDLYLQQYDPNGNPIWSLEESALSQAINDQKEAAFTVNTATDTTRLITVWSDYRLDDSGDIYGQILGNDRERLWEDADGAAVNTVTRHQEEVVICSDQTAGAYVGWIDGRSSGKQDINNIYAQHVYPYHVVQSVGGTMVSDFRLRQNYPNPFNPETTIEFELLRGQQIKLIVYNILGEEVAKLIDAYRQNGLYRINFDGSGLASGTYFYVLRGADRQLVHKMLLLR